MVIPLLYILFFNKKEERQQTGLPGTNFIRVSMYILSTMPLLYILHFNYNKNDIKMIYQIIFFLECLCTYLVVYCCCAFYCFNQNQKTKKTKIQVYLILFFEYQCTYLAQCCCCLFSLSIYKKKRYKTGLPDNILFGGIYVHTQRYTAIVHSTVSIKTKKT